eukprot:gene1761-1875_t
MSLNYAAKKKLENGHNDGVWSFAWTQGSIVSGSIDGFVKHWNIHDGKTSFVSKKHKVGVTSIVALQDGSMAIACYQDSVIRFFDLINKTEKTSLNPGLFEAFALSLSPGEDILASGSNRGNINIWSMQEGNEKIATIPTQNDNFILSTSFSVDGKLAFSGMDGSIKILDLNNKNGENLVKLESQHSLPVRSVVFSPTGNLLYTASDDRQISIYDMNTGKCIHSFSNEGMMLSVDASPDQRYLIGGSSQGKVLLYDIGMRRRVQKYDAHSDSTWCVKYNHYNSQFGEVFASSSDDSNIQIFEFQ